jgi:hypothetical protein
MFATLFVQVFGITKYGGRIGGTANFEYFPDAMYTIYQMVIGVRTLNLSKGFSPCYDWRHDRVSCRLCRMNG